MEKTSVTTLIRLIRSEATSQYTTNTNSVALWNHRRSFFSRKSITRKSRKGFKILKTIILMRLISSLHWNNDASWPASRPMLYLMQWNNFGRSGNLYAGGAECFRPFVWTYSAIPPRLIGTTLELDTILYRRYCFECGDYFRGVCSCRFHGQMLIYVVLHTGF